jgi:cellulose synthase/poly-beta-1,6-N-acetylglucosamine synthase-like glycosyltransferase
MREYWKQKEKWNNGTLEYWFSFFPIIPSFHHSIVPVIQYSITPILHYSNRGSDLRDSVMKKFLGD